MQATLVCILVLSFFFRARHVEGGNPQAPRTVSGFQMNSPSMLCVLLPVTDAKNKTSHKKPHSISSLLAWDLD